MVSHRNKSTIGKMDIPMIDKFMEILSDSGFRLWDCKLALAIFHPKRENLIDESDLGIKTMILIIIRKLPIIYL